MVGTLKEFETIKNFGGSQFLLILSCSQRKSSLFPKMPAILRYDGTFFRLLRKARWEGKAPQSLDILILSAKHGWLEAQNRIPYYDHRVNQGFQTPISEIISQLKEKIQGSSYREIFSLLGKEYFSKEIHQFLLSQGFPLKTEERGIGFKAETFKKWLREKGEEEKGEKVEEETKRSERKENPW